ncbi:MAG: hypothetical protein IJE12_10710 [Prevotella sp.]|nr:hypothetical protein [Prevotella sp.]
MSPKIFAAALMTSASAVAQKKIGDFIESRSNNADKRGVASSRCWTLCLVP